MNKLDKRIRKSVNWGGRRTHLLLVAVLIMAMLPVAPPPVTAPSRVQPLLLEMSKSQPEAVVSVIVQKTAKDANVEALVTQLGGRVTKDLSLINAFAAEMSVKDVPQLAQTGGVRWVSFDAPVQQSANKFTTWATTIGTVISNGFTNAANVLSPVGINRTYGYGGKVKGAFGGFFPEYAPGQAISRVEVVLRMYVSTSLTASETPKLTAYVGGQPGGTVAVPTSPLNGCVGLSKVCAQYVDITASRAWKWSDFKSLQLVIDQSALSSKKTIYYDAVGVRLTTAAGTDSSTPFVMPSSTEGLVDTSVLTNTFQETVHAIEAWNTVPYRQGAGVTVAVVDSGSFKSNAIGSRLIGEVNFNSAEHTSNDQYGHGTFVTSLIADDGSYSGGKYTGVAPKVNILGVRVSDDAGMSTESDVINALQWVYNNSSAYNIRVVNLSLNSSIYEPYNQSPLDAACEILWFNGLVVVASAGNNGSATLFAPANDPFVITVGALDEKTADPLDDVVASFSAYGIDETNSAKPDLVAPGANLIAYLPDTQQLSISVDHPANRVDSNYFRMSGTSMAAPLVSGAAAILLEDEPGLTPDQVKYRLKNTANSSWPNYNGTKAGAGILNVYAAVTGSSTQSANTGKKVSDLLITGSSPVDSIWGSVQWNSVQWNSVQWNSVQWNSVQWNSVQWNSDYWGP